jgi:hypothetical protein
VQARFVLYRLDERRKERVGDVGNYEAQAFRAVRP